MTTPPQRRRRTPEAPAERPDQPPDQEQDSTPGRLYAITAGHEGGRGALDLVTLIVARGTPPPALQPELVSVLQLCGAPLSVAELSAYLKLPFSVVTVLLTELHSLGLVQARQHTVRPAQPDRSLLEAVMHGLQRL
ncbi:DUF742 domain-containing protein [Streptomyces sp. NPDC049954]|uniref:DUF742 domain-containing protein n=1 Tax=Streptomyces sp. NPDC049954 TaxID=3155779 RepID=UPI00341DC4B4